MGGIRAAFAALGFLCLVTPAMAADTPHMVITPAKAIEGDPVSIKLTGLTPGAQVTLYVRSQVADDTGKLEPYYSEADFKADEHGMVDLATDAPVAGAYEAADVRGLFWSERPLASDKVAQAGAARLGGTDDLPADVFALDLEMDGKLLDHQTLTLLPDAPDTVREAVHEGGVNGVFYHMPKAKRQPVIVVLGGSEGGTDLADWLGPKLAPKGYAVFGLDYYDPAAKPGSGMPTVLEKIPVESLEKTRDWLSRRPEVDATRLGLVGYSKGAEFALLLASLYDWIKVAVAYVPSDYVWQGIRHDGTTPGSSWTRGGNEVPYLAKTGTAEAIAQAREIGGRVALAKVVKHNIAAASPQELEAARIKLEDSHAALLLIGSSDDEVWDSSKSVKRMVSLLTAATYEPSYQVLTYAGAGHDIVGTGWRPTTGHNTDFMMDGGTPAADAHAEADSWPKVLAFLQVALHP